MLPSLSIAGIGTTNKLAKWLDNTGTVGDSALTESGGFLGVGTASPSTPLDVVYGDNNFGFGVNIRNTNTGQFALVGYGINGASGSRVGQFVYVPPGYVETSLRDSIIFSSTGPTAKLGFVSSADGSGTPDVYIRAGGTKPNSVCVKGSTGFVGFGVDNPLSRLHAAGDVRITGAGNGLLFPDGTKQTSAATGTTTGGGAANSVPLWTGTSALGNSAMTQTGDDISGAGNLNVSGNAVVAGNIAAKYQDVAEWVPASVEMKAGTVVVLDVTRNNTVAPSSRAYDTHVAGVVSAQPGVILGEGGDGQVLVATTDRVKVRVDATRRPVRVGDLLVTSGRQGVAMRSVPVKAGRALLHRPGTIIGKALEPLPRGEGEILVLLSLQ